MPEDHPNGRYDRVLVVAAHPDDPEFAFGASVAQLTAGGADVWYVICTDGSQGGEDPSVPDAELTAVRYAEQRAAAEVLGVRDVVFLGFRDGHLAADVELRKAITREIRRFKPDLVLTHSPTRVLSVGIGALRCTYACESARCMRSIALSRSGAQTISFAISES